MFLFEPVYDLEHLLSEVLFPLEVYGEIHPVTQTLKPRMDLHEDTKKNLITATFEFPGVSKEDISVDVHQGKLTVSAETKQSDEHNENGYAIRERCYGKYSRTLQLPQGVEDEVSASIENGVLTVIFPKWTPELAPKRIIIS